MGKEAPPLTKTSTNDVVRLGLCATRFSSQRHLVVALFPSSIPFGWFFVLLSEMQYPFADFTASVSEKEYLKGSFWV